MSSYLGDIIQNHNTQGAYRSTEQQTSGATSSVADSTKSSATVTTQLRPSPLLPSPPNSPHNRNPASTYGTSTSSSTPTFAHPSSFSISSYSNSSAPSMTRPMTQSFDSEAMGTDEDLPAAPSSGPHFRPTPASSTSTAQTPSWSSEALMAEEFRRFGRSNSAGYSQQWDEGSFSYATAPSAQSEHYMNGTEGHDERTSLDEESQQQQGHRSTTMGAGVAHHDYEGRHYLPRYDFYPGSAGSGATAFRSFSHPSYETKSLAYGSASSAEQPRTHLSHVAVPSHSHPQSHLTYEALCAPGYVGPGRGIAAQQQQQYTHLAPMLDRPTEFDSRDYTHGEESPRSHHLQKSPTSLNRHFGNDEDSEMDPGDAYKSYVRESYSPSPPDSYPLTPKQKRSTTGGKMASRSPESATSGASRPISPITGRPTKVIAKRVYPPRDAAKRYYFCSEPGCGKSFGRPSARDTHMRSHNGEQPFMCPITSCSRAFSVFSNLKRHMVVHPEVDFRGITVHDLPRLFEQDGLATHSPPPQALASSNRPTHSPKNRKRKSVNDDDDYIDSGSE